MANIIIPSTFVKDKGTCYNGKCMRILAITYYFPPLGGPGVQRILKFVKYLRRLGEEVSVLTVKETAYYAFDASLFAEIPAGTIIRRSESYDPFRFLRLGGKKFERWEGLPPSWLYTLYHQFFIPDTRIGWLFPAVREAKKIIKEASPDVIFATAPPFTALIIAKRLSRMYKIPVVMDMRDPWSSFHFKRYLTPLQKMLDESLERRTLLSAERVVVVAPGLKDEIELKYPELRGRVVLLTNGYDEDDMKGKPVTFNFFTILHLGTLYGGDSSPEPLFKAFSELLEEMPDLRSKMKFLNVGSISKDVEGLVRKYNLEGFVEFKGYIPHGEAISLLRGAHLLVFIHNFKGEESGRMIPQRVFEYMASRKPILDIGPPKSYSSELLERAGLSLKVLYGDVEAIKNAIIAFYEGRVKIEPRDNFIVQFSRRKLAEKLREILREVIQK